PGNADDEECDDGNLDNTDACTSACLDASCGDGGRGPGEDCDTGTDYQVAGVDLYPSHPTRTLTATQRDDGYVDEEFFCNPDTCQLRCLAGVDRGGSYKGGSSCIFVPEASDLLDDADGTYTPLNLG